VVLTSATREISSDEQKPTSFTPVATLEHSSDVRCWRNQYPSLLCSFEDQVPRLFIEQLGAPYWNGRRRLHINWNYRERHSSYRTENTMASTDNKRKYTDDVEEEEAEESTMTSKKQRITPPPHQPTSCHRRRKWSGEPALMMGTPPTQRMTLSEMTVTPLTMTGGTGAMISSPMKSSIS
jgi:hypothetical protein